MPSSGKSQHVRQDSAPERPKKKKGGLMAVLTAPWFLAVAPTTFAVTGGIWMAYSGVEEPIGGDSALNSSASSDPSAQLLAHLWRRGSKFSMRPVTFDNGLQGMGSDKDLKPGATVMTIPLNEVLYHGTVDIRVKAACDKLPCNMSRAMLALGVAYERNRGKDSRFAAFIKTLPAYVTNYVGWPLPMLKLMEVAIPGTQGYLSMEMREMRGANAFLKDPVSENDIAWGIAMVQTRAFGAAWDGKEALIPGATFLNHHWDPEKAIPMPKCDIKGGKCFVQTGPRKIAKGDQLYFHYRPWSNLQLLIRYGFEVPDNPWGPEVNVVPLRVAPQWLQKLGCETKPLRLRKPEDPEAPPFPEHDIRCARAATMANESVDQSKQAEKLWQEGAFNVSSPNYNVATGGSNGFVELSKSCKLTAAKWTDEHSIEIITEVASLKFASGNAVIVAIQHDLTLLMRCEELFKQLAMDAGATQDVFTKIDEEAEAAAAARKEERLRAEAEKKAEQEAEAASDASTA